MVVREQSQVLSKSRRALFTAPGTRSPFERLRIGSITKLPDTIEINFELPDPGISFRLRPGESGHGIELVAVNHEEDFALIESQEGGAIIHLQKRRISPIYPEQFFVLFGLEANGNVARQLIQGEAEIFDLPALGRSLDGDESDAEVALKILKDMNVASGLVRDLSAKPFGALVTDRNPDAGLPLPADSYDLVAQWTSGLADARRAQEAALAYRDMVITGLRLFDQPDATIPVDRFSPDGKPLEVVVEEDAVEVSSPYDMSAYMSVGRGPASFRIER